MEQTWFEHTHQRVQDALNLWAMIGLGLIEVLTFPSDAQFYANEEVVISKDNEALFAYFMKHLQVSPEDAELVWLEITLDMAEAPGV